MVSAVLSKEPVSALNTPTAIVIAQSRSKPFDLSLLDKWASLGTYVPFCRLPVDEPSYVVSLTAFAPSEIARLVRGGNRIL